jgi:acetyl esterase/lipase
VPPLDLDELGRVPSWMLFPPGAAQSEPDAASPVSLLHKDFPPTILVHGAGDRLFAARSSVALHQKLLELGGSTELHIYSDRDH